ncbi:sigma-70 family RNA polymerase sigma factor [Cesiribacter andamanensis]|uniref:RNA polymerase sigma factor SigJ n=1 Tax=Cesiribacter andamanensis AMV16 TaxID=1279009 RepID=M7NAG0_9BACT|nr:sigma-70 family RNA polymerase sigma factor [Cesiribacter andamanensis]EMR04186.1 RNA polymerase sigma factor SigJ [Cesiribacter andamanensis AMV16]
MQYEAAIVQYHPLLLSIAQRMVKNMMDAEDIVQDTFLKFLSQPPKTIENLKAYLVRAVVNNCLNHLKRLKQNAEELLDPLLHAQWTSYFDFNIQTAEREGELSEAFKIVLQKLEPSERTVYLFREVFNFDYAEIAEIVEKRKDNCRQLFCRAQAKLQEEKIRFSLNMDQHKQTVQTFVDSCKGGSFMELVDNLKEDFRKNCPLPTSLLESPSLFSIFQPIF